MDAFSSALHSAFVGSVRSVSKRNSGGSGSAGRIGRDRHRGRALARSESRRAVGVAVSGAAPVPAANGPEAMAGPAELFEGQA